MSIMPNEEIREDFKETIRELQKDINILIEYASDTDDIQRKEHIESLKAKLKYNINSVQAFKNFD